MNPYIIIGLLVAWASSLGVVGWWQNGAGHTSERVAWEERENKQLAAANASIKRLEEKARADEQAHVQALASIAENHQKEIADAEIQKQNDVAAARAGRIVLRISAPCVRPNGGSATGTATGPSLSDGRATAELPRETAASVLAIGDDADAVVRQLRECQAVVRSDRSAKPR